MSSRRWLGSPSPGPSPSPSPTTAPLPCAPRPAVTVSTQPAGDRRLAVTIAATPSTLLPNNELQSLHVEATTSALVDIAGQVGRSGAFSVSLPSGTRQTTFVVRRVTPGQAVTIPLVVVDGCGPWKTFVGGGPTAF